MKTPAYTMFLLLAVVCIAPAKLGHAGIWHVDTSGDWLQGTHWDTGIAPNSNDSEAVFNDSVGTSNRTVFANEDVTVHRIELDSTPKFVLAGQGRIVLDRPMLSTESAELHVLEGDHELQLPLKLDTATNLVTAPATSLAINGPLDLNGQELNLSGGGTVALNSGKINGNGGTLRLVEGVLAGAGAVDGDLDQTGGIVQVGNVDAVGNIALGTLNISSAYTQAAGSELHLDIGALGYDVLVGGSAILSGRLKVSLDEFKPEVGDRFKILDFVSLSASFSEIMLPDLNALPAIVHRECGELSAQRDCTRLSTEGVITVIPEPGTVTSLWCAGGALLYRRLLRYIEALPNPCRSRSTARLASRRMASGDLPMSLAIACNGSPRR